jgi:hypothetical protein
MTAFSAAIDAIFTDPNMAADAVWMEGGVPPGLAVRVIKKMPDEMTDYGAGRAVQPTLTVDVRVSEAPRPRKDDRLNIGAEFYIVQAAPMRDVHGLVWTLNLRPA